MDEGVTEYEDEDEEDGYIYDSPSSFTYVHKEFFQQCESFDSLFFDKVNFVDFFSLFQGNEHLPTMERTWLVFGAELDGSLLDPVPVDVLMVSREVWERTGTLTWAMWQVLVLCATRVHKACFSECSLGLQFFRSSRSKERQKVLWMTKL